ncbi:MAG: hypothetical protein CMJ42_18875 [Phyllobacteriaceae bacterium]|nr:hypothetical protein [Phyllobacteriaceae bacterium]MBA91997.1 hypothetical protein [Phyllobacteriaceae bacterium]
MPAYLAVTFVAFHATPEVAGVRGQRNKAGCGDGHGKQGIAGELDHQRLSSRLGIAACWIASSPLLPERSLNGA